MAVATTNNLRFAGDVYINSVSIQGYNGVNLDITNQIIGINIYESIFTPFISGSVIIEDTLDLANLYPLVGQELIHIDIDTPSLQIGNIRESFMLYKMTDRIPNGDKSNIYSLEFISVEAYVDINKKVSLPFSGNISEMAEKIIHSLNFGLESRKQSIIQKTKRNHKFISNYWSPVAMLNYLARQAVGEDNSTAFVFFENRDGFNFTSYEELSNGQVYQDFLFDKHTRDLAGVSSDIKNVQRDYTTILDIEFKSTYDYIEKIRKGMFSSKFTGYDLFNKQYMEKKYLISEDGNDTKLNKYNPYTENAIFSNEALHKNYMFASNTFESITGDTTNFQTLQNRLSYTTKMGSTILDILVPGRLDYTCGLVVNISLPIRKAIRPTDVTDDIIDNRFSGKYVVGKLNHIINRERHTTRLELFSNSMNKSIA